MAEIFYFCGHEQFQPEILVEHARAAEAAGFDGIMISEHFQPWVADAGASGFAFSTLGAIAQATKKIKLITAVVSPLFRYHPAVVAQAAATIDRLSQGRFMLGIGTGEPLNEVPLGYPFPPYKERSARILEAIEIIKRLLEGEKLSYKGTYYTCEHTKLYSPPLHKIPIFMAASGSNSLAIAARHTDGIITSVKDIEATKKTLGEEHTTLFATHWSIYAKNREEAYTALQSWRGLRVPSRDKQTDPFKLQEEADQMAPEDILKSYSILASADEYIQTYAPLITKLRASYVGIQTTTANDQIDLIRMLGEEVVPALRYLTPTA